MITNNQLDKIALDSALGTVFCNVGEAGWPADPIEFLERSRDEEGFHSHDEMIPWAPFENEDADSLYDLVDDFKATFKHAINAVLVIERG